MTLRTMGLICTCTLGWLAARSDIRTLAVPDRYQAGLLMLLTLGARTVPGAPFWPRALTAALFAGTLLAAGRSGSLGGADIKLAFTLTYTLGMEPAMLIFMFASVLFLMVHGIGPRLILLCPPAGDGSRRKRQRPPVPRNGLYSCGLPPHDRATPEAFVPFIAAAAAPAVIRLWMTGGTIGF